MAIEDDWDAETARREFRQVWNEHYELLCALRDMPETIPPSLQIRLAMCGKWPEDKDTGKRLQLDKASGWEIPFKSECELGAGFWHRLRTAVVKG